MEICWLCAWAAFSLTAITGKAFPVTWAFIIFILSSVLTHISYGKGWRVIQVGGLHILGFACAAFGTIYAFYYSSYPIADTGWFYALFHQARTALEWLILVLILVWIFLFWIGGYAQSKRQRIYPVICSRFDLGLAAFFCLFLIKLVLFAKGGIKLNDPFSSFLIFPFFLLSFLATGMTRIEHQAPTQFLPGYRSIGIVLTFALIILLYVGAVSLFFLPFLTAAADTGYTVLKSGAGFVLPVIERVLRFVFMGRGVREDPAESSPKSDTWDVSLSSQSPWMEYVEKVMKWGIEGLGILLLVFGCGLCIYLFIRWLLSRTRHVTGVTVEAHETISWITRLWAVLVLLWRRALFSIRGYAKASELYDVLLRWGRRSGLACFTHETPLEFGDRLAKYFPRLKGQIDLIVRAFNREVYGELNMSGESMKEVLSAWRIIKSPRHWPLRFKIRFLSANTK